MTALRLSPKNTEKPNDLLMVKVDVPSATDKSQHHFSQATTLNSVIPLLSSQSLNDNKQGIQLLLTLTKLNKIVSSPRTNVSKRIVMDASDRTAYQIRTLLLSFLCNDVDTANIPTDDSSIVSALSDDFCGRIDDSSIDDDSDSDDDTEHPTGRHWGELHCPALRVVVNCLEHLSSSQESFKGQKITMDYSSFFWKRLVQVLSTNIESGSNEEVCGYSLRCLRLLLALDSNGTLLPVMKYMLLPFILNLNENGKSNNYAMVHDEATRIIKRLV